MGKPLIAMVALRVVTVLCAVGLTVNDRLPWWFTVAVVAREVVAGSFIALRMIRRRQLPDTDPLAPAGALLLLVGMALVGAGSGDGSGAVLARVFGWASAWWGLVLSWGIVVDRAIQLRRLLARDPDRARP